MKKITKLEDIKNTNDGLNIDIDLQMEYEYGAGSRLGRNDLTISPNGSFEAQTIGNDYFEFFNERLDLLMTEGNYSENLHNFFFQLKNRNPDIFDIHTFIDLDNLSEPLIQLLALSKKTIDNPSQNLLNDLDQYIQNSLSELLETNGIVISNILHINENYPITLLDYISQSLNLPITSHAIFYLFVLFSKADSNLFYNFIINLNIPKMEFIDSVDDKKNVLYPIARIIHPIMVCEMKLISHQNYSNYNSFFHVSDLLSNVFMHFNVNRPTMDQMLTSINGIQNLELQQNQNIHPLRVEEIVDKKYWDTLEKIRETILLNNQNIERLISPLTQLQEINRSITASGNIILDLARNIDISQSQIQAADHSIESTSEIIKDATVHNEKTQEVLDSNYEYCKKHKKKIGSGLISLAFLVAASPPLRGAIFEGLSCLLKKSASSISTAAGESGKLLLNKIEVEKSVNLLEKGLPKIDVSVMFEESIGVSMTNALSNFNILSEMFFGYF